MNDLLLSALSSLGVDDYVQGSAHAALVRTVSTDLALGGAQDKPERLPRLGFAFERLGVEAFRALRRGEDKADEVRKHFLSAFHCWRSLLTLDLLDRASSEVSPSGLRLIERELGDEPLPSDLALAFRLAVSGLMAERTAEIRLELRRFQLPGAPGVSWKERVLTNVVSAFTLLARKGNGWEDIDVALDSINELRALQKDHESTYLDNQGEDYQQVVAAAELVGLYHLAQIIASSGEYLRDGRPAVHQVTLRVDRNHDRAVDAFKACSAPLLAQLADLLWVGCTEIVQNSIWTHVSGLGQRAEAFARVLAGRGRPRPVIELWPSQQDAFRRNFNDPYRKAILVEMPTSAGKTLLAKFAIVQAKSLNPNGRVAYVVPTRALVNQVTLDLRADFAGLAPGLKVEQAVPAFELDPTEDRLLTQNIDVLVTTPEKLDLLLRRNHVATQDLALVIADEAHNIREQDRGPRLELLLGMIKRDRAGARFLLLSPFLPNDDELVGWLGDDRALAPISVDWKPNRRMVGGVRVAGQRKRRALVLETLPAAGNTDIPEGFKFPIGQPAGLERSVSIGRLTGATVKALAGTERGAMLILCRGRRTAMTRAAEIAGVMPQRAESDHVRAVCRYLEAESGPHTPLIQHLRRGIAYHHSGLSHEARWLIEGLIRRREIQVICGTTTLAQGVNFPISTVIVETLKKGDADLSYQDFWNIAGRAGRALEDTVGIVVFPIPDRNHDEAVRRFLRKEADVISSRLAFLVDRAGEISQNFNLNTLYRWPELSSLLQFLAHAMRVSGQDNFADDVEDLLRSSLVYHQVQKRGDELARRLVDLCRAYLQHIQGDKGVLTLADQTGFATPSVLNLLARKKDFRDLANVSGWKPESLFGDSLTPLTRRIELMKDLPEIRLGRGEGQPFSPQQVASILRDWVRGDRLDVMAARYPITRGVGDDIRVAEFSQYLFSRLIGQASWGMGALESIYLSGPDQEDWKEAAYVPSMIFFGVKQPEAVWFRMAGAPRVVAEGLAGLWKNTKKEEPTSYDDIRAWISGLGDNAWAQCLPPRTSLTPADMRLLWREFVG